MCVPGLGAIGASFAGTQYNSVHQLGCSIFEAVWDRGWSGSLLDGHPRGPSLWAGTESRGWCGEQRFVFRYRCALSSRLCHHKPNRKMEELGEQTVKKAAPYKLPWRKHSGQSSGGKKWASPKPCQSALGIWKDQISRYNASSAPSTDEAGHRAECKGNTLKGSISIFTEPRAKNKFGGESQ